MKFSRQSRLLKPAEFKSVFQNPVRSGDDCFRILARTNEMQGHRLGMAITKKVCAKAVGRNRIKRVVRENFRKQMAGSLVGSLTDCSLDIVVLPNATAKNLSNKTLDESLSTHWQRLIKKAEHRKSGHQQNQQRTQK